MSESAIAQPLHQKTTFNSTVNVAIANSYQRNLSSLRANHLGIQQNFNVEKTNIKERNLLKRAGQSEESVHLPKLFQREAKHSRPDPYEIIEAVRHRNSAEQSSMQEKIQAFKAQLPERFSYGEASPTRQLLPRQ